MLGDGAIDRTRRGRRARPPGGRRRGPRPDGPAPPAGNHRALQGGPVGIDTLAAAPNEPRDTLEDVYEPYLLQQGFLARTARGRVVTDRAYEHLGLPLAVRDQQRLF